MALAGGAESMSLAPYLLRGARFGLRMGDSQAVDMLSEVLTDCHSGLPMGVTAENLAERYGISREEQDAFASLSHERAAKAQPVAGLNWKSYRLKSGRERARLRLPRMSTSALIRRRLGSADCAQSFSETVP